MLLPGVLQTKGSQCINPFCGLQNGGLDYGRVRWYFNLKLDVSYDSSYVHCTMHMQLKWSMILNGRSGKIRPDSLGVYYNVSVWRWIGDLSIWSLVSAMTALKYNVHSTLHITHCKWSIAQASKDRCYFAGMRLQWTLYHLQYSHQHPGTLQLETRGSVGDLGDPIWNQLPPPFTTR